MWYECDDGHQHRRAAVNDIQRPLVPSPFKYFKRNTNLEAHSHFGRALNDSAGEDWRLSGVLRSWVRRSLVGWNRRCQGQNSDVDPSSGLTLGVRPWIACRWGNIKNVIAAGSSS